MRILLVLALAAAVGTAELTSEIIVRVDGKEQTVADGATVEVKGTPVGLTIGKTQLFTGDGYSFRLGRQFSLEKDEGEEEYLNYTFDGTNVVFDVYDMKAGGDADEVADLLLNGLALALKKRELKTKPSQPIAAFGREIAGREAIIDIAGIKQRHAFYVVKEGPKTLLLTFQYTDDAVDVAEYRELTASLKSSLKLR